MEEEVGEQICSRQKCDHSSNSVLRKALHSTRSQFSFLRSDRSYFPLIHEFNSVCQATCQVVMDDDVVNRLF